MAQTALMPVDPAVSPQQVNRILPIRANLLPAEINMGRNARRVRFLLIGIVLVVILALAAWYVSAVHRVTTAQDNLDGVSDQILVAQNSKKPYGTLTGIISETTRIDGQLQKLLANDLPWNATLDKLRATGTSAGLTVTTINGSLNTSQAVSAPGGTNVTSVATLSISGEAPDKNTIAKFVELLGDTAGVANPYLTTASQGDTGVQFTLSAELTSKALCGRFSGTECKTEGN